ncbi:MAG: hypothetical protein PWR32_778 [Candidatus Woesearchaeota archaeon]|nr:hypothetical protein [Candidatus Woesearchaeota archaeon]
MSSEEEMSKEERIGFHKGAISVLAKERAEMLRIVSVVEQLMQMHLKALADLGVDLSAVKKEAEEKPSEEKKEKKPIDELLS